MRATVRAVKLGTTYLRTKPLLEHLVVGGLVMRHRVHRVPQLRKLEVHAAASAALISQWPLREGNEMLQARSAASSPPLRTKALNSGSAPNAPCGCFSRP